MTSPTLTVDTTPEGLALTLGPEARRQIAVQAVRNLKEPGIAIHLTSALVSALHRAVIYIDQPSEIETFAGDVEAAFQTWLEDPAVRDEHDTACRTTTDRNENRHDRV